MINGGNVKKYIILGGVNLKKYKRLSLLLVVLMIATLFTGCNKEEKGLVNALIKSQEMLSLESTSDLAFHLSAEGLDEESQVVFDEIANQINNMKLSINQKSVANEDQTVAKAQVDAKVQLDGMSFDSSIWVDMDMSSDQVVMRQIFKLPSMLMSFIPDGAGKEYIELDFDKMNQAMADMDPEIAKQMNMDETMAIAMKYQKKFADGIVEYIKDYDFDRPVVRKLDDQIVNDEAIQYYEISLDNDSFKEVLKYTMISMLEDENIMPLFEAYMTELMNASGEEMPEGLSITGNSAEMVEAVKEFFKTIEDLTILGEDGILITLGINEGGYFVSESGKIHLLIDTKQLTNLMAAKMGENEVLEVMPTPVFELSISYDTKINHINENISITMPATTEENTIDYMELIESMVSDLIVEEPQAQELMVIIEDEFVEFTNEPILVNDHYLVSTRDMAQEFDAAISWNQDTKEIIIQKDEILLVFNVTNNQLVRNGELQNVTTDIVIRDDVSYIPLRAIAENLGYTFEWNQEFKMMVIYQ